MRRSAKTDPWEKKGGEQYHDFMRQRRSLNQEEKTQREEKSERSGTHAVDEWKEWTEQKNVFVDSILQDCKAEGRRCI